MSLEPQKLQHHSPKASSHVQVRLVSIGRANSTSQARSCQGLCEAYHGMTWHATYTENPVFPSWHIGMLPLNRKICQRYRKFEEKASSLLCLMFHAISVLVSVTEAKKRIRYMKPRLDASLSIVLSPCICKEEEKSCLTLSTVVSRLDSQIKVGNT